MRGPRMLGATPVVACCIASLIAWSCSAPSTTQPADEASQRDFATSEPSAAPSIAPPTPSSQPAVSTSAPSAQPAAPATCSKDADCAWDDPCAATRCVGATTRSPTAVCEETAPPPGECLCVAERCTLKPKKVPEPSGNCVLHGCAVDHAGGTCISDPKFAELEPFAKPVDFGPSCDCVSPDKGCTYSWFEKIPCKSDAQCWIERTPRTHPIGRPKTERAPFKPCRDGSISPECGKAGHCTVGPVWKC